MLLNLRKKKWNKKSRNLESLYFFLFLFFWFQRDKRHLCKRKVQRVRCLAKCATPIRAGIDDTAYTREALESTLTGTSRRVRVRTSGANSIAKAAWSTISSSCASRWVFSDPRDYPLPPSVISPDYSRVYVASLRQKKVIHRFVSCWYYFLQIISD